MINVRFTTPISIGKLLPDIFGILANVLELIKYFETSIIDMFHLIVFEGLCLVYRFIQPLFIRKKNMFCSLSVLLKYHLTLNHLYFVNFVTTQIIQKCPETRNRIRELQEHLLKHRVWVGCFFWDFG